MQLCLFFFMISYKSDINSLNLYQENNFLFYWKEMQRSALKRNAAKETKKQLPVVVDHLLLITVILKLFACDWEN